MTMLTAAKSCMGVATVSLLVAIILLLVGEPASFRRIKPVLWLLTMGGYTTGIALLLWPYATANGHVALIAGVAAALLLTIWALAEATSTYSFRSRRALWVMVVSGSFGLASAGIALSLVVLSLPIFH